MTRSEYTLSSPLAQHHLTLSPSPLVAEIKQQQSKENVDHIVPDLLNFLDQPMETSLFGPTTDKLLPQQNSSQDGTKDFIDIIMGDLDNISMEVFTPSFGRDDSDGVYDNDGVYENNSDGLESDHDDDTERAVPTIHNDTIDEEDEEEEVPIFTRRRTRARKTPRARTPTRTKRRRAASKSEAPVDCNVKSFHELTDKQLAGIDFKDLTRLMAEAKLSKADIQETKARRRRLKNRQSARVCSNKKRERCSELITTNKQLEERIAGLTKENDLLRSDNHQKDLRIMRLEEELKHLRSLPAGPAYAA